MLNLLGNVIWFVFGGIWMAIGWFLIGCLMIITVIGIPWAKACFSISLFMLWPFGRVAVDRADYTGEEDIGTGSLGFLGNIIWLVFGGLWLAIGHILCAVVNFITIIGIPFGFQHFKFAKLALMPVGKIIVTKEEAAAKGVVY